MCHAWEEVLDWPATTERGGTSALADAGDTADAGDDGPTAVERDRSA